MLQKATTEPYLIQRYGCSASLIIALHYMTNLTKCEGNIPQWTWNTIMATDGSALTWGRRVCGHDDVSYFPYIFGTRMTRVNRATYSHRWLERAGRCGVNIDLTSTIFGSCRPDICPGVLAIWLGSPWRHILDMWTWMNVCTIIICFICMWIHVYFPLSIANGYVNLDYMV